VSVFVSWRNINVPVVASGPFSKCDYS
jgi:hypothetical protein